MAFVVDRSPPAAARVRHRVLASGRVAVLAGTALLGAGGVFAQTKVFRCEVGGRVVYQQSACSPHAAASAGGTAGAAAAPAKAGSAANPPHRAPGGSAGAATSATTAATTSATPGASTNSAVSTAVSTAVSPASVAPPRR